MCAVYFTLGNLHPKHRSKLKCIHFALLADSKTFKCKGIDAILKPLIADLLELEAIGVTVQRHESEYIFKGSVLVFLADNLGSHQVGGFMESFSAWRSCRFCMITLENLRNMTDISQYARRNVHSHKDQIAVITADETLCSVYGVKRDSILNSLQHFHVAQALPSDAMHDIF